MRPCNRVRWEAVMTCRQAIGAIALSATILGGILDVPAMGEAPTEALKYPDFESQWRNPTAGRGGNPWDPTKPMGLRQQAPLTPEYQAKFEASVRGQATGGQGNSPGSTCLLA